MRFRIIDTYHKPASWNMAFDQVLLELAHKSLPTIRFLSFSPHCALVGNFQSVEQEIRVDYCRSMNIDINRRITGGGAIYFDESQLGWEIIGKIKDFNMGINEMNEYFGNICAEVLKRLGIPANFKQRNDVEVNGRKISGMGGVIYKGNFLFQGTLLVQDRIEQMLYALKVPVEKLKKKEIDSVRERVTCIENEIGRIPEREEIKKIFMDVFKEKLNAEFEDSEIKEEEKRLLDRYLGYFSSDEWINKVRLPEASQGVLRGAYRSSFGTIKMNIMVNKEQNMIRSTYITGDFFEDRKRILDLERLLKNIPFNRKKILKTIDEFFEDDVEKEAFYGCFNEIFRKFDLLKMGLRSEEANRVFTVNIDDLNNFSPEFFLLPYCSKKADCPYRRKDDCLICGDCTIGDAYSLSNDYGLKPITILSFEDLMDKFDEMRKKGVKDYIGSCCEPFFVKHQEEFRESKLRGILIDIENSTCYDLGKAKDAYYGRFESETSLNLDLIKKVLKILFKK